MIYESYHDKIRNPIRDLFFLSINTVHRYRKLCSLVCIRLFFDLSFREAILLWTEHVHAVMLPNYGAYSDSLNRASSRRLLISYLLPSLFASYAPLFSDSAGLPSLPTLAATEYSKSVLLPLRFSFGWTSRGVALLLPLY
jgi:hypothetical protein